MASLHPTVFTHRLLKSEDWRALVSMTQEPLYALRQAHPLSQGMELSPLADQALRVLVCPTVARIQALRTALRHVASPDLQVEAGPYGELGLLMLATHVEIASNKQSYVLSARQGLVKRLELHGLTPTHAWDAAWISLKEHQAHPFPPGAGRGTHLSFDRTWASWALVPENSAPWVCPPPPLAAQQRMVESHLKEGRLGPWLTDNGWRLRWLVEHLDPHMIAQALPGQVHAAVAHQEKQAAASRSTGHRSSPSAGLADGCLAESLEILSHKLGRPVGLDWSQSSLGRWLPQCIARQRAREASPPSRVHGSIRPRLRS